jgi:hypothetical protein
VLCKHEVVGSIPSCSTRSGDRLTRSRIKTVFIVVMPDIGSLLSGPSAKSDFRPPGRFRRSEAPAWRGVVHREEGIGPIIGSLKPAAMLWVLGILWAIKGLPFGAGPE